MTELMLTKYIIPIGLTACIAAFVLAFQSENKQLQPIEKLPLTVRIDEIISQEVKQQIMADVNLSEEVLKTYKKEFKEYPESRKAILPWII